MIVRLFLCLAAFALCLPVSIAAPAQSPALPLSEMRGLWVVRDNLTSPGSIRRVVEMATAHRFNALFVQVRGRGDAFYASSLEPRAEALADTPVDFDPLAETLRQAHAAGLQVHAWMNTCYVWGAGRKPYAAAHVVNQHPDWLARDARNGFILQQGRECEGAFLTPANLAARKHIHDVFLDVARRYDIDGLHFDYVRYACVDYDYSDAALAHFQAEMQPRLSFERFRTLAVRRQTDRLAYPHAFPNPWQEFRRRQMTEMVGAIAQDAKALKPSLIISAAVFADSKDARETRGQDWKLWLQRGYLDAVVPMAYGASTPKVAAQIADAVACARASGRFAYAGLGAWHIPAASTVAKIGSARSLGAQGFVLFSYGGITKDGTSAAYLEKVRGCCPRAAVVPTMPWLAPRPAGQQAGGRGVKGRAGV